MNEDFKNVSQPQVSIQQPNVVTPTSQVAPSRATRSMGRFFTDFFVVLGCGVALFVVSIGFIVTGVDSFAGGSQLASVIMFFAILLLMFLLPAALVNSNVASRD